MYLPSRKFVVAMFSVAMFIVAGWWFLFSPKNRADIDTNLQIVSESHQKQLADTDKDSDGDGLKDWEEVLWKTDPYNADSNDNGVQDFIDAQKQQEEISRELSKQTLTDETGISLKDDNLTKQLSADFGAMYLRRKVTGTDVGDISGILFENIRDVITAEAQKTIPDMFSANDVQISQSETSSEIKDYINAIGSILSSPPHTSLMSEPEILQQAFIEEDIKVLANLLQHHENYEYFLQELQTLPAPASLADTHLLFLNSIKRLSIIMQRLTYFEEDPVRGFAALAQYGVAANESLIPLGALVDVIKQRRIEFAESESGILFNTYVALRRQ